MVPLGWLVAFLGVALAARSALLLAGRGRPRRGLPPRFVLAGPYLRTRNPLLAGVLVTVAGLALALDSWPVGVGAVLGALVAHQFVVRIEEPRLRARFGSAYAEYLRCVPRWLPARYRPEVG